MLIERAVVPYLRFWSRCVLRRHKPLIIGVTGSAGKTTTVEMIAAVLGHDVAQAVVGKVAHSQHNMNCDRGLPLTILRYANWTKSTTLTRLKLYATMPFRALKLMVSGGYPDVLVLEYAAGGGGHIEMLSRLAPPDIAAVTTIGPAHLERLKTVEAVAQEKGALVEAVPASGLVVLGQEHDYVDRLEARARAPVVKVDGKGLELAARIAGVIAKHLGVPEVAAQAAMADFRPLKGRMNVRRLDGLTLIDDSFNANPLSMKHGLEALQQLSRSCGGRRFAILGEMAEMGEEAPRFHHEIGELAKHCTDSFVGVGKLARLYGANRWYPTSHDCAEHIGELLQDGDCILVKGSHAAHMGPILQELKRIGGSNWGAA